MRTFRATNVRDFVVTAAADYRIREATVGDTVVRVVVEAGLPGRGDAERRRQRRSRKLEARLGPYPYRVLKVVQSAGRYGMEGPGVAWIPTGTPSANLRYLVTHEIAHQWFYGIVGNDQAREPFADEAATDMVARRILGLRRASRCATDDLDRSIYRYSAACYYEVVYIQGGNLLDNARRKMGSTSFWAALRGYIADHRWGISHTRTLLDALDAATPLDLRSWWRHRFPTLYRRPDGDDDDDGAAGDGRRRGRLRRDLRAVRRGDVDLVRARAADRGRHGGPDREDHGTLAVAGGRGRRRRPRATRTRTRHRDRAAYDWTIETAVYVDAAFAGRGIGRLAMTDAARRAPAPGVPPRGRRDHAAQPGVDRASTVALGFTRIGQFEAIGWKFGAWHGVEWFGLELGPRDEPAPIRPLAEVIAEWQARAERSGLPAASPPTRRSAASACGNQRQRRREDPPPRAPRRHEPGAERPLPRAPGEPVLVAQRRGGSSPIDGTSSQS